MSFERMLYVTMMMFILAVIPNFRPGLRESVNYWFLFGLAAMGVSIISSNLAAELRGAFLAVMWFCFGGTCIHRAINIARTENRNFRRPMGVEG